MQRTAGQLVLERPALRDVAEHEDGADVGALRPQRRDAVGDVERVAVRGAKGGVGVLGHQLLVDHVGEVDRPPTLAQHQLVLDPVAEQLVVAADVEHLDGSRVGEGDLCVHVERDHALALRVGDRTETGDHFSAAEHVAGHTREGDERCTISLVPRSASSAPALDA